MERVTIDPDEKVLLRLRRHWILLIRDSSGTIVLGLLPFALIPLVSSAFSLPFTVPTPLVSFASALWLLIVWLALSILWTNYYLDLWIITNRRILSLDQVALFQRRVTSWSMDHIQEVSTVIENPLQAFLGYGTIEIQTAGPRDENARIPGIPHPERIRVMILEQVGRYKQLVEKNKKQEGLLHTISHEVKGYLTKSEAAFAAIADGDVGAVPETVKSVASTALESTRKGVDTVVGILESANLKTGTMELSKKRFDVRRAVIEIAEDIREDAERKGLSFDIVVENGTYNCDGDEGKLRRMVFRNLIDNAVRYTALGGVHISLASRSGHLLFSVKDTGVGITRDDLSKLFTEGGKGKNSLTVNPESTGYGLFIAKNVVDAHGGKIWAESDGAGRGAAFFVELPSTA